MIPFLTPAGRLVKAKEAFEYWMREAEEFYENYGFNIQKNLYRKAAFMLHQTVENAYNTFLLVATDYKPKTHHLEELRRLAIQVNKDYTAVFDIKSQEEQDRWQLLIEAYIAARYKKDYLVTPHELEYLNEQAQLLMELSKKTSQEIMDRMQRDIDTSKSE